MAIKMTIKIFDTKYRKGFTYMLVSGFIIIVLLTVFLTGNYYSFQDREEVYQVRIRAMNDFVHNFNQDAHRATYIAAFRGLLALEDDVNTKGKFLTDANSSFKEVFYYGTVNNTEVQIMENSSFEEYIQRVNVIATQLGMNLYFNVTQVKLSQADPWSINVTVIGLVNITDSKNLASWVYTADFVTNVPILDLRDPLYGRFTLNKVPNTIRRINSSVLVNGSDISNLIRHINGSYYLASNYSPNFLMRFEGNMHSDPNGIESLVSSQKLSDADIHPYPDNVKVDFIYFYNLSSDKVCNVEGIDPDLHFVIPINRTELYQISGLDYNTTCP